MGQIWAEALWFYAQLIPKSVVPFSTFPMVNPIPKTVLNSFHCLIIDGGIVVEISMVLSAYFCLYLFWDSVIAIYVKCTLTSKK